MNQSLTLDNVSKSFGDNHVLKNVNVSLNKGYIYVLVGGNGAGKTTLFNLISGFLREDEGHMFIHQTNITKSTPLTINQNGVSRTFQNLRLIEELSVFENVKLAIKGKKDEQFPYAMFPKKWLSKEYETLDKRVSDILEMVYLKEVSSQLAKHISYGQQKLLTLACCIANEGNILLLDEPIAGINEAYQQKIVNILLDLKKSKKTILIIEHQPHFIEKVADTILFLSNGVLQEFDSYSEFIHNDNVQKTYL